MLTSKFTLGGDASVAAGPMGRDSSAQTDALMNAEILTWSRQRGVFAGIALTGATLREDSDTNKDLYSQTYTNKDILGGTIPAPGAAAQLIALLDGCFQPEVVQRGSVSSHRARTRSGPAGSPPFEVKLTQTTSSNRQGDLNT